MPVSVSCPTMETDRGTGKEGLEEWIPIRLLLTFTCCDVSYGRRQMRI